MDVSVNGIIDNHHNEITANLINKKLMENLNLLFPEIVLFLGICAILMIGVFLKNSFQTVLRLSILVLISVIYLILKDWGGSTNFS